MQANLKNFPTNATKKLISHLNQSLADAIDLKMQIKFAHWNVKGPSFIALHELFDQIAAEVETAYDLIAERVVQLGGVAEGTTRMAAEESRLKEFNVKANNQNAFVQSVTSAIESFNGYGRALIEEADELGDAVTADIFTQIVRGLDKQRWFVESHLSK